MSVTISEAVKYIGVDDKTIDLFESQYVVPHGVSYNSYLIFDEKVALMDTVDARGMEQWEKNLLAALDGRKVDYLIVSHLEPDHAGSIGRLVELFPEVTLVGNAKTFQMLPQFFDELPVDENHKITVAEGESLSLGTHTLNFYMAPMVHWPEVMVTYESSEKILFSADGFGKFGALDYEDPEGWACEARRYYFNIVGKYGAPVQALLKKAAGLDIRTICPLHGPVLKENLGYYIGLYDTWSSYKPEDKGVLVAYASIHGNTAKAAQKFAEMLRAKGVEKVSVMDIWDTADPFSAGRYKAYCIQIGSRRPQFQDKATFPFFFSYPKFHIFKRSVSGKPSCVMVGESCFISCCDYSGDPEKAAIILRYLA